MLKFINHEDETVINILDERGDAVGDFIVNHGKYNLSLLYLINNTSHIRQIADKLDELNSK
jgi:hypothetical protein